MMSQMRKKELKCVKIMNDLKQKILNGDYKAGDQLPSENTLTQQYQVSRQTIRQAIAILTNEGYVYAEHGRGTFCSQYIKHTKTSKNIAVVITYMSDYIFPRVIQGIDSVLAENGYSIILKYTKNSRKREVEIIEELLQKDIDGIIIEPSKSQIFCKHKILYDKMDEHQIPYVFMQGYFPHMQDKPYVIMDDEKGGYLVTKYLLDTGHKNLIGVFKADDMQGQRRHKGFVKALQEKNICYDPDRVIWFYTEDRDLQPYQCIKDMVSEQREIDGVVCYNDQTAAAVIKAFVENGVRVPEDVSITGYDHSMISNMAGVDLTTILHPQEKLGEMAAQLMLDIVMGNKRTAKQINIEPELIIGDSCKKRI